jgi:hypothetical protein
MSAADKAQIWRAAVFTVLTAGLAGVVKVLVEIYVGRQFSLSRAFVVSAILLAAMAVMGVLIATRRSPPRGRLVQSAWPRVVFDALVSVGVLVAGFLAVTSSDLELSRHQDLVGVALIVLGLALIYRPLTVVLFPKRSSRQMTIAPIEDREREPRSTGRVNRADGVSVVQHEYARLTDFDQRLRAMCEASLSVEVVHYLGYFVEGECLFSVDVLEEPKLQHFSHRRNSANRRSTYMAAGRLLYDVSTHLDKVFADIESGILIRTVLDVENGGLFHLWLDPFVHLVGVTLDQEMIHRCDSRLAELQRALSRALPRGAGWAKGELPEPLKALVDNPAGLTSSAPERSTDPAAS